MLGATGDLAQSSFSVSFDEPEVGGFIVQREIHVHLFSLDREPTYRHIYVNIFATGGALHIWARS